MALELSDCAVKSARMRTLSVSRTWCAVRREQELADGLICQYGLGRANIAWVVMLLQNGLAQVCACAPHRLPRPVEEALYQMRRQVVGSEV